MPRRRILSLWFPRLAAELCLRAEPSLAEAPLVVISVRGQVQEVVSVSATASAAGGAAGVRLADARAVCPDLVTRQLVPHHAAQRLMALCRWAGRYSPWVATEGEDGLMLDITGCAHLFGGEAALARQVVEDAAGLGLTLSAGLADTPGAAWAVAHYAGQSARPDRTGDAIRQEARATRSKAAQRPQPAQPDTDRAITILAPGMLRSEIAPLPVAALRIDSGTRDALRRLGLATIGDLLPLPRATLARRFGLDLARRLDQALGAEPEPISPVAEAPGFATRLSFPDPIGLYDDLEEGAARLADGLCQRLTKAARGVRRLRLELLRADGTRQALTIGLARASSELAYIRPLIALKLKEADAGYGVDVMRLIAEIHEPLTPAQHAGHAFAAETAKAKTGEKAALDALLSRLGTRVGLDAMTRLLPAESHLPEKGATIAAAAFSEPVAHWPRRETPRPLILLPRLEPIRIDTPGRPPEAFRWRRRDFVTKAARGPERIAPEWWLDNPGWRSGPRDYWDVITASGERLWLVETLGGEMPGGWFMAGDFG